MRRMIQSWLVVLAIVAAAHAEQIVLKDGSKVLGRMTAIHGDKIEFETPYGKMQLQRADIQTIDFPENHPSTSQNPAEKAPKPADESLNETSYVNRTGNFGLTVPIEWSVLPAESRTGTLAIGALASRDRSRYIMVIQEEFSGSLEAYKEIVELQTSRDLENFQKVSESPVTIDGHSAFVATYRGLSEKTPIVYSMGLIGYDGKVVRVVGWCIEPLFKESQRTFETIISSYHQLGPQPQEEHGTKPPSP